MKKKSTPVVRCGPRRNSRWRSGRDSNPRYGFAVDSLSRRAPSTTRPPLRIYLEGGSSKGRARAGQGCRAQRPSLVRLGMTPAERLSGRMPSEADIDAIARETLERLPSPFAESLRDI